MLDFNAFHTVIFDLDGVVIDSEALHARVNRQVFAEAGLAVPDDVLRGMIGRETQDAYAYALRAVDAATDRAEALIARKWTLFDQMRTTDLDAVPGALGFVEAMAARYGALGLVTSSGRAYQRFVFARFGLAPYFTTIVTGDDLTDTKPHPAPYLMACARLGLAPSAALVFEDSINGVESAVAAGCTVVGITTSFAADALRTAGAHHVIDGYEGCLVESQEPPTPVRVGA